MTVATVRTSRAAPSPPAGVIYGSFLRASVQEYQDGGSLSVLSALARLDLDAWSEASELARLPTDAAVQRLSSLLRRVRSVPDEHIGTKALAAELIKLLPSPAAVKPPVLQPRSRLTTALTAALIAMVISSMIMFGLDFVAQQDHASLPQAQLQAGPEATPRQAGPSTQPK